MFKIASFEEEIYQSMEKNLVSNQLEGNHNFNKLAKVAECLHAAAEIFEDAGMVTQAEEVTEVLRVLVKQLSRKTS